MRFLLTALFLLFLTGPSSTSAYFVSEHNLSTPYELFMLERDAIERQYIVGELDGYPEMVEFSTDREGMLSVLVLALPSSTTPNFGGMVVRVLEPRGVEEIARLKPTSATWTEFREPVSKLTFLAGPEFEASVASGTYRIEVSTPENFGKYLLVVGSKDNDSGYGETWRSVATLYEFAGVSKFFMIRTSLVYYPLFIFLVICGFAYTVWRTRDRLPFLRRYV